MPVSMLVWWFSQTRVHLTNIDPSNEKSILRKIKNQLIRQFAPLLRGGREKKKKDDAKWRQKTIVFYYYNYVI